MRIFGVDRLAGAKIEPLPEERHGLRPRADEMHLDPALRVVENRLVPEAVEIEIGAEFAVGAGQQVQVECGGHPGGVVVGRHQPRAILAKVDADDEAATAREARRHAA